VFPLIREAMPELRRRRMPKSSVWSEAEMGAVIGQMTCISACSASTDMMIAKDRGCTGVRQNNS
jgi:hypothetical protein